MTRRVTGVTPTWRRPACHARVMALKITFSDNSTKTYTDDVHHTVGDAGTLTITDGDDKWIYAPHAWVVIKTEVGGAWAM